MAVSNKSAHGGLDCDDARKRQVTQLLQTYGVAWPRPPQPRGSCMISLCGASSDFKSPCALCCSITIVTRPCHSAYPEACCARCYVVGSFSRSWDSVWLTARRVRRAYTVGTQIQTWISGRGICGSSCTRGPRLQDSAAPPGVLTNAVTDLATACEQAW